ncbi:MAG: AraC family transcriptional regulator [Lachnospiraceae bacterium]|nr:AraC family transcriptional regulator [Lachnospiraceae bacterium]
MVIKMSEAKKEITIYYCGHEECASGHFFGPAIRPHYLMHFILKGKGHYRVNGKKLFVQTGEAFLIQPEEITYYKADEEEPWEYVWMAFDGARAEQILQKCHIQGDKLVCTWRGSGKTEEYIRTMGERFESGEYSQNELLGFFYLIMAAVEKNQRNTHIDANEGYDRSYLKKALSYIRHNYSYDIRVSDIAKYVGIERTYLYKIFMKYQQVSPKQYLTDYRIRAAKDMLTNTRLRVTEIGLSCGFHDSSVFCKNFIKIEHKTPLQYRKNIT